MIAAERQQRRPLADDPAGIFLDCTGRCSRVAVIEEAIADVGDGQLVERVELHAVGLFPGHDRRCVADRARAEACAGPVGGGGIERYAHDGEVHAVEVPRVLAAHERGDAGIGRLRRRAVQAVAGYGMVV